jgi:O-antigen ligase
MSTSLAPRIGQWVAPLKRQAIAGALGLVGLLFCLPFLWPIHRHPITTFDSDLIAAVILGLALIVGGAAGTAASMRVAWHLPLIALGLLAIGTLQYALGYLQYTFALSSLFLYACAIFTAYLLGRWLVAADLRSQAVAALALGVVLGGLISVAVQVLQVLDVHGLPDWLVFQMFGSVSSRRPFANLAQPNLLASYFVWGTIAAAYLVRRGAPRRLLLPAMACLFGGLALTGSRMGTLFGVGAIALLLMPNAISPETRRQRVQLAMALVAGYAAGLAITALLLVDSQGAMPNAIERFGEGSIGQRLSMWSDAWRIALAHPWLGVGVGEYGGAQYLMAQPHPSLLPTNNPHNIVLHVAAEFGLPAAVLFVAVLAIWFRRGVQALRTDAEAGTAVALVTVILAHSMLEYPLWAFFYAIPVALLVGLAEPALAGRGRGLRARVILAPIGIAVLGAAAVMKADYDEIAPVYDSYLHEVFDGRSHAPETVLGVTASMGATYFRPQMERLFVELVPATEQKSDAGVALVGRVLTRLADVRVMVRYIELLLQAGRIEEVYPHIARLKLFAGDQYPLVRDELLQAILRNGAELDPVRRALTAP